jgi:hypothetical protein
MGVDDAPRPAARALQRAHHRHEVVVPQALQFPDAAVPRLRIGLPRDQVDQLVGEFRHVHQLRPGPCQAGPELRQEMPHPRLAARDAVGLEQPHLRPAQAETHADRLVDFLGGRHTVLHQPQRLAPDGFEEPVGDMGVDLLADGQGEHADGPQNLRRSRCPARIPNEFDQAVAGRPG